MTFRRSLSLLLLCLMALNTAFGTSGSMLLCIHDSELGHLLSEQADDCCHGDPHADEEGIRADLCDHCTDITLTPADLTSVRLEDERTTAIPPLLLVGSVLLEMWQPGLESAHLGLCPRDPPLCVSDSFRGTRSVILRL